MNDPHGDSAADSPQLSTLERAVLEAALTSVADPEGQFQRQVEKMHRVNHRIFLARNRWKRSSLRKVRNLPIVRRVHQLVRRAI